MLQLRVDWQSRRSRCLRVLIISRGARVVLSEPTATLVERYFGEKTEVRDALPGHISPVSCAKAEAAFGYQPQFVWSVSERHLE